MTYLERNNKRRVCTQFVNDHCAIRRGAHLANVLSNLHINSKGRHGRVYAAEGNNATYHVSGHFVRYSGEAGVGQSVLFQSSQLYVELVNLAQKCRNPKSSKNSPL